MKTILAIVVCAISLGSVRAQLGDKPDTLNTTSGNQRARMSDSQIDDELQRYNITEDKTAKLKELGLDLRGFLSGKTGWDERAMAAITDLVIIGKVLSIQDMPGPESVPFHSTANVLIVELLRGPKLKGDTIHLLRKAGPVTGYGKDIRVFSSADARIAVGETSVLYIDNIEHDQFLNSAYKNFFSHGGSTFPRPSFWIAVGGKLPIRDSLVEYNGHKYPLDKFTSEIREMSSILDTP